jgi:cyclopropane fatty-acyl-phospholipid synthase-like methyltransferase
MYLKTQIRRALKISNGLYLTFVKRKNRPYSDKWWDDSFYTEGLSDSKTIGQKKPGLPAAYHYASIELIIAKLLWQQRFGIVGSHVLDIGSGSGHWIHFYRNLGCEQIQGVDVSEKSIEFLSNRFRQDSKCQFFRGTAIEFLNSTNNVFDIVNAIGVMFHIVDDGEWERTLTKVSEKMRNGGILIIGGYFGIIDGINVGFNTDSTVNKRLRSKWRYFRILRKLGFSMIKIKRNRVALDIDVRLPESHILIAVRGE